MSKAPRWRSIGKVRVEAVYSPDGLSATLRFNGSEFIAREAEGGQVEVKRV